MFMHITCTSRHRINYHACQHICCINTPWRWQGDARCPRVTCSVELDIVKFHLIDASKVAVITYACPLVYLQIGCGWPNCMLSVSSGIRIEHCYHFDYFVEVLPKPNPLADKCIVSRTLNLFMDICLIQKLRSSYLNKFKVLPNISLSNEIVVQLPRHELDR
jgi:hypothetical protein